MSFRIPTYTLVLQPGVNRPNCPDIDEEEWSLNTLKNNNHVNAPPPLNTSEVRRKLLKTANLPFKMNLRSKHLEAASLLIFLVKILRVNMTCHPTEFLIGTECCPLCPSGNRVNTHCTEFRSTSCLPCVKDTYMNLPTGLKNCFPCTTCGPDSGLKIYTLCTATTDSVCEPMQGFYCTDRIENHCAAAQRHKQCQPGKYIKHRGTAQTDSQCSDCSDGTFSDGTLTSCRPHTQCESQNLMQPGTASTDAECGSDSSNSRAVINVPLVVLGLLVIGSLVA
ncbi:tumor necrosis factor receptor superfamily member 14-like [Limanda limanda]|uniref:tumor necrosis factor receptor superfamily member 14-like n=1 Tax=Limanda limanda TaxID=27771 RepID=UPI0029C8D256|nr:tumor necrosis factor receptor superfamily member 14-like [Limanda limanda]